MGGNGQELNQSHLLTVMSFRGITANSSITLPKYCNTTTMRTITLLLALLLIGCSTERQCARAAKKCAHLWHTDTAYVHDSVTIERTLTDTLLQWQTLRERDTVTIRDGRATVRIVRLPGDSIWVQGECGDTVIRYVRQMVTNRIEQPKSRFERWLVWWHKAGGILGLMLFAFLIARRWKN